MIRILTVAAAVAALFLVLLGRVIPLPPLVTGEEGSRVDLAAKQTAAVAARYKFQQAQLDYQHFLATPPYISNAIPDDLRKEADDLDAGGDRQAILDQARSRMQRILDLGHAMYPYSAAGDEFFTSLKAYDDDLMSWSRTLGPRSEDLRRSTWPILAWLDRYPAPIGSNPDSLLVPASANSPLAKLIATLPPPSPGAPIPPPPVSNTLTLLESLSTQLNAPDASAATIRRVALAADDLWAAGKYIPQNDMFLDGYFSALRRYDAESLEVAATPEPALATRVRMLAWAGAVLLALVVLGALLLMFAPPAFWRRVPWLGDSRVLLRLRRAPRGTA